MPIKNRKNAEQLHGKDVPEPTASDDGKAIVWDEATGAFVLSASASSYTDENAQDAVGGILVDGTTIDFTYNDETSFEGSSASVVYQYFCKSSWFR